jgi:hypothetical protein
VFQHSFFFSIADLAPIIPRKRLIYSNLFHGNAFFISHNLYKYLDVSRVKHNKNKKTQMTTTTMNNTTTTTTTNAVKRKSPGPHFKNPLVNVYKNNHVHQDVLVKMASLYPVKLQDGYNVVITFNGGHSDMPVYVSEKDLVSLYNIKIKDEDSAQEMSKEAKCNKMVSMVIDHIKNKYKICLKQKCPKKVKMVEEEDKTAKEILNMDDLFSSDEE